MSILTRLFGRTLPSDASASWIEAAALAERLKAARAPLVVDVRDPDEFTGPLGHIAGARNLPLPEISAWIGDLAAQRAPVVVVCRTDRRSAAAAGQLRAAGAGEVAVLHGGMEAWRKLGLPVE